MMASGHAGVLLLDGRISSRAMRDWWLQGSVIADRDGRGRRFGYAAPVLLDSTRARSCSCSSCLFGAGGETVEDMSGR